MSAAGAVEAAARLPAWRGALERLTVFQVVSTIVVVFFAVLATYPLLLVLLSLFVTNGRLDFAPLLAVFALPGLGATLLNTVIVVFVSSTVSLAIASLMAWVNERTDARLGFATDTLPMIPFLVPPIAGAIGWVLLLSDRAGLLNAVLRWALAPLGYTSLRGPFNIYSWPGLIFVYVIYSVPYAYMMMASGLRNLDASLEEQSRICGRGALATLLRVTFPAVLPSVGAACTLLIWLGFSLFSVPVIIGQGAGISVLSVQLVRLLTFTYPPQMAAAVGLGLILVATLGAAWFVQGRILRSGRFATIGGKGRRAAPVRLGIWKGPARFCVLAYVAVAAVLPAGALVLVALNGFWTPRIKWGALGLDTFRDVLTDELTARSLLNSLSLAIVGATIGILVAAILALFVQRSSRRLGRVVDLLIKLPASISSIVLAVGFILAFSGAPFYLNGTYLILLLGYLALYLPQGSVSADAAAAQVGRELSEASQVAGASDGRTLMRISLPLMAPGLVAGWALLFVRMLSDLTVSSVLAGTSNPVVGFRILDVYQGGSFAMLAALSTLVTLVSAVVIIGLMMFSRRRQSHA